jgi:hypothetical protein
MEFITIISVLGIIVGGLFYIDIKFNESKIVTSIARKLF